MEDKMPATFGKGPYDPLGKRHLPSWVKQRESASSMISRRLDMGTSGSPEQPTSAAQRVDLDHRNIRKTWKSHGEDVREYQRKARAAMNSELEPVRDFPGGSRVLPVLDDSPVAQYAMTQGTRKRFTPAPLPPPPVEGAVHEPSAPEQEDVLGRLEPSPQTNQEGSAVSPADPDFLKIDQSTLPVEIFDLVSYEELDRPPEAWLETGVDGKSPGGAVPYFKNGSWKWRHCEVHGYDKETKTFRVKLGSRFKEVRRLNILFDSEDRGTWEARRKAAHEAREEAKRRLRFDYYIHRQTMDEFQPIQKDVLHGIHDCIAGGLPPDVTFPEQGTPMGVALQSLTKEVVQNYARTMKKAVSAFKYMQDPEVRGDYERLKLAAPPMQPPPPKHGKLQIPEHDFGKHSATVSSRHFSRVDEVRSSFVWLYSAWNKKVAPFPFMEPELESLTTPCELSDLEQVLAGRCSHLTEALKTGWHRSFTEHLVDNLQDQFDFFQSKLDVYERGPLCKLLKHTEMRMAQMLRSLMTESLDNFKAFLHQYRSRTATGERTRDNWELGIVPLLRIRLVAEHGVLRLSPSADEIRQVAAAAIDRMVETVRDLTSVDSALLSLLSIPPRRICDVGAGNPVFAAMDDMLQTDRAGVSDLVSSAMREPEELIASFEPYAWVLDLDTEEFLENFMSGEEPPSLDDYLAKVREFHSISVKVRETSREEEYFEIALVDTRGAKETLVAKALELRNGLLDQIIFECRQQSNAVVDRYEKMLARIAEKPANESELAALKEFITQSKTDILGIIEEVAGIHRRLGAMDEFSYRVPVEDIHLAWSTMEYPKRVDDASVECELALEEDKVRMMDQLALEKTAFEEQLEMYEADVKRAKSFDDYENQEKRVEEINALQDAILEAKARGDDFNEREKVFGFPPTEYAILNALEKDLEPFFRLWNMISDFHTNRQEWLHGEFRELKGNEINAQVEEWWKASFKLAKSLDSDFSGPAKCAMQLREDTTEFREHLPVISSLASPALKKRHWEELSTRLGHEIVPDEDLTLQFLLSIDAAGHIEGIQEICVKAEKEYSLERNMENMKAEWRVLQFEVRGYRETGTFVVGGIDDIMTLLDDHIVKTQTMRGSMFIGPIEGDAKRWEAQLKYAQLLLDEWLNCQKTWMYLEPIFSSDDIMRQLPTEARRFQDVDKLWRKVMADTEQDPVFIAQASPDKKLLEKFRAANEKLDKIQKGLNDYLEVKRLYFPRFFFLSPDQLIEILSQTKEPRAVQPHLNKAFEGINQVKFEKDLKITEMISQESEKVKLIKPVDPESAANKGNVERWLLELEDLQWQSIRDQVEKSRVEFPNVVRTQWMLNWPAQVILLVSQIYWTRDVTKQIQERGVTGIQEYLDGWNQEISKTVMLVRGKLSKLDRKTIGALCVIDVHARETLAKMVKVGVSDISDFEWTSQLRYYWEPSWQDGQACKKGQDTAVARIVNARCLYGYEYLGNSMRLVITPLTDRCYRTMISAIDLLYGGAPEGPAGTGKTETVKDLSKAVAIQCVVFNCSDGLDYKAMAKFFKGLAGCGSWCCFDEFNRINVEVLSVIAQQILTINKAKASGAEKFHFEGTFMKLNMNCNVFITMNPGYAGRAELPDNLKALFRPCAMMVPDYALIGEIRLYSFGFEDAKTNAQKLVKTLQLSSEQLSSQKHYDYGMRAVNSILVAAGNLRQALGDNPEWDESKIVLRSVYDVNLPKFTVEDLPLFFGITSDLFPGVKLPQAEHGSLVQSIQDSCTRGVNVAPDRTFKLEAVEPFTRKVVQLYEMVLVRHGVMIVGQTGSGKTSAIHTLKQAMSACCDQGDEMYQRVQVHTMNPKSIKSGQLYGNFDENTHEWSDGILAVIYRNCAFDTSPDRQWVLFDGPVDAVWIENMNTVLDDNKKLCLMSGEIIKMTDRMTMMFEAEDLEQASPATVSRVGMIFCETRNLGWRPLRTVWLDALPETLAPHRDFLSDLFEWLLPPAMWFVTKQCAIPTPVTTQEMAYSLLRLMNCFLDAPDGYASDMHKVLECAFVKALIWSVGACTNTDGRQRFDGYLRRLLASELEGDAAHEDFLAKNREYDNGGRTAALAPPDGGQVYDYRFDVKKGQWANWVEPNFRFAVPRDATYNSIVVPTVDTIRHEWLISELLIHGYHVLCTGDTGTGKSVSVKNHRFVNGSDEGWLSININFSAQTSANATQDIIDGKLDKRRKGVLGPPLGRKCIVFVDDLNMPAKEEYGAQPPIEILRQWMDHSGWYDRVENAYRQLVEVQFIAAMGPPGGGRQHITQRYIRHFNLINFVPFNGESLQRVFGSIVDWFLGRGFSGAVKSLSGSLVGATVDMYETIAQNLLPTPLKSHYTFNLRDMSKVFQGIAQATSDVIKDKEAMTRLWCHECLRVFHDRLVSEEDRDYFNTLLAAKVKEHFAVDFKAKIKPKTGSLLFGNFIDPKIVENKPYVCMDDPERLRKVMDEYLDDFNSVSRKPMSLVLFQNAIEHVSRISRIINQPYGNALLVGVGGSGRKSLTTLAVSVADFKLFGIEISRTYGPAEWREDLKRMYTMAGVQDLPTVFLFDDTQIIYESFLEDINGILNTGEVPNLFNNEEMIAVTDGINAAARAAGVNTGNQAEMYNFFIGRVRNNLHVVLCLSPIGDAFRTRLRMFPALVNCCTIDWFTAWPEEALRSVAKYFLDAISLDDHTRNGIIDVCVNMQQKTRDMSERYKREMGRFYYVTPTSYLELINTFKGLLQKQRDGVSEAKSRYDNGLEKIFETQKSVDEMQQYLTDLQPKLKQATEETDALLVRIEKDTVEANEQKAIVSRDEVVCKKQAEEANAIKESCEADLAEAIPALEGAIKALNSLSKSDIVEVKNFTKPPAAVKLVMEAVCIMMKVSAVKVKDPDGGTKKVDDYWEPAKKQLLSDPKFLSNLVHYEKDNMDPAVVTKVTAYTSNPDFEPEKVKKGSVAAAGLCKWIHAMIVYDRVAKNVAPKRAALAKANGELAEATAVLEEKQALLQGLLDKLAALQSDLDTAEKKKADLQDQVTDCATKLRRAEQLINGLGGERDRWKDLSQQLETRFQNVTGDIMLSAGQVAYTGAFTSTYRSEMLQSWSRLLQEKSITCSDPFSLRDTLGSEVEIRGWIIAKLPNDTFSIENAIMLQRSNRWPLMIDPQGQANKWVKKMEADSGLKVVKQNNPTFVRTIENCLQFGNPVLLENVPETLDPILEPVLLRQVVTVGGIATIKLGDNAVEYDPKFKMYITSKLTNPHYPPELCVKVNLLNFMATAEGLEDQMLGLCVAKERPELEAQREVLVLEDAQNKKALKEIEDQILYLLKTAEGNILDDEVLIETLAQSKVTSNTIEQKVKQAERTQATIASTRASYQPVAFHVAQLFFCIADLASIDPMYQYSLEWYINLFLLAIDKAAKSDAHEERLENLKSTFSYTLYVNVCRSLFAKDKLLFSFLLTTKIMLGAETLDPRELRFLLQGNTSMDLERPNPAEKGAWPSDKTWGDLLALAQVPALSAMANEVEGNLDAWRAVYDSKDPAADILMLTGDRFSLFQRLCISRAVRPDVVVPEIQQFIAKEMGEQFIDPPPFDLMACYEDSNCTTPLIFVLTPGADPMTELYKVADELGFGGKKLTAISLGQGQGEIAEKAISEAQDTGKWVCLQNCHLCVSWLPTLERICEELSPERVQPSFRLWLTSEPSKHFPGFILQNGVKMTNEPPKGIKANLAGSYYNIEEEFFESCRRPSEFKKLLFGLCFFHATVRERKKFGPLGWNNNYVFSGPDLRITMDQLKIFLDSLGDGEPVPYAAISYLAGECNYGGRVTDDKDRRCLMNILTDFYTEQIQGDAYRFSPSGTYFAPADGPMSAYVEYIKQLPFSEGPEIFGLNENANISCALAETELLLNTALSLQPKSGGGSERSWDEVISSLSDDIQSRMPEQYDIERALLDFPTKYEESMNTVITQELVRFNRLTLTMKRSLKEIKRAIAGLVVLSGELEAMGNSMVVGQVPNMWTKVAYPSLKPLGSWVSDLLLRLDFLREWMESLRAPNIFWISGFFFTQAFLTGTLQNFARKYQIPIDQVAYDFAVLTTEETDRARETKLEDGSVVHGLFLDSARFDEDDMVIAEAKPRELFFSMPHIHMLPRHVNDLEPVKGSIELMTGEPAGTAHVYLCPVYKTSVRRGVLSTTGHSTNFVISMRIPMAEEHDQKHWIKRGVAMLTQLDD